MTGKDRIPRKEESKGREKMIVGREEGFRDGRQRKRMEDKEEREEGSKTGDKKGREERTI
jgi:hypothetical protein